MPRAGRLAYTGRAHSLGSSSATRSGQAAGITIRGSGSATPVRLKRQTFMPGPYPTAYRYVLAGHAVSGRLRPNVYV